MTTPKIDPGEGWRLLSIGEIITAKDEIFYQFGGWNRASLVGLRVNDGIYRRRVEPKPEPASMKQSTGTTSQFNGGWLDLETVKPEPLKPIWVGKITGAVDTYLHGCSNTDFMINHGWTHWQPATVPAPPKAPEPELTPEQEACEGYIIDHPVSGVAPDICHAQRMAWWAALAWERNHKKANP